MDCASLGADFEVQANISDLEQAVSELENSIEPEDKD